MQNVLTLWRMRNITPEQKIIFKTLVLSKIAYNINNLDPKAVN